MDLSKNGIKQFSFDLCKCLLIIALCCYVTIFVTNGLYRSINVLQKVPWHFTYHFLCAVTTLLVVLIGYTPKEIGFTRPKEWRKLYFLLLPSLFLIVNSFRGSIGDKGIFELVFFHLLRYMFLGFFEETLYRGIVQKQFKRWGVRPSICISAVLFGAFHILSGGVGAFVFTSNIGMAYSITRQATNTIWPLIIIHGLTDFMNRLLIQDNPRFLVLSLIIHFLVLILNIYFLIRLKILKSEG